MLISGLNQLISNENFNIKILTEKDNKSNIISSDIHGANINIENNFGETPLSNAFENGNEAIIKYLVEHGANLNKCNKDYKKD
eukprot:jgi/Orpsp1_1/1174675/evm.model.c7180000050927.2